MENPILKLNSFPFLKKLFFVNVGLKMPGIIIILIFFNPTLYSFKIP